MSQLEERIQNILQEEVEMPKVVNDKAGKAFLQIQQSKNEKNQKGNRMRNIKIAVMAVVIALSIGMPVNATIKHFGLMDYFELRNKELVKQANEMVVDEVEQQPQGQEGKYIDFWIREYMCDNNLFYAIVEAKPKQDNYFVIPQWVNESDSVEELNIPGVTEGSIAEYAALQGKDILCAGVSVDIGAPTYSYEFQMEEDGTALYIISGIYGMNPEDTEFTCNTFVQPPNTISQKDVIRNSFVFNMTEKGEEKVLECALVDSTGADEVGIVLDDVVIVETELCTHVEFLYHYAEDISEAQKKENASIELQLVDENGKEYTMVKDGGGWLEEKGNGSFKEIRNYKKVGLPSELTILVKNYETDVIYGKVKVKTR